MKRWLANLLLLIFTALVILPSFGEQAIDYSTLSDEALMQIIRDARIEWTRRELRNSDEYIVALDSQGVQLVFLGTYGYLSPYQKKAVYLDYIATNANDFPVMFTLENTELNGWGGIPFTGFSTADPNSKTRNSVGFYLENASVTELSELEDLTFTLNCLNRDTLETIDSVEVTIIFEQMTVKK